MAESSKRRSPFATCLSSIRFLVLKFHGSQYSLTRPLARRDIDAVDLKMASSLNVYVSPMTSFPCPIGTTKEPLRVFLFTPLACSTRPGYGEVCTRRNISSRADDDHATTMVATTISGLPVPMVSSNVVNTSTSWSCATCSASQHPYPRLSIMVPQTPALFLARAHGRLGLQAVVHDFIGAIGLWTFRLRYGRRP